MSPEANPGTTDHTPPLDMAGVKRAINALVSKGISSETDANELRLLATTLWTHYRAGNHE